MPHHWTREYIRQIEGNWLIIIQQMPLVNDDIFRRGSYLRRQTVNEALPEVRDDTETANDHQAINDDVRFFA